jgi:hypothetical protein
MFSEDFAYFVVDDRRFFRPAGLAPFARSKGGHLCDDPAQGRIVTMSFLENWIAEFTALEQGAVPRNLTLVSLTSNSTNPMSFRQLRCCISRTGM